MLSICFLFAPACRSIMEICFSFRLRSLASQTARLSSSILTNRLFPSSTARFTFPFALGAFLHPRWCRFSPQWEVAIYILFHSLRLQRSLNGLNLPQTISHFQNTHIHPPILDQGQVKHTLNSTGRIMDMGR